jgi:RNA ligase
MEKKANHQANIVRLGEPRVHPNADKLEIFDVGEYQVVSQKGTFKAGDLAVYIQPDSVVPQTEPFKWIWESYVGLDGTVPEKRRRITVKRLRKEWSEGLLLPVTDFDVLYVWSSSISGVPSESPEMQVREGDDVSELIGITHYDPDLGKEVAADSETFKKKRSKYPRSLKGWWYLLLHKLGIYTSGGQQNGFDNEDGIDMPVFDVDAFKHYKTAFDIGELVEVTEKIHGSNARFVFRDGHMYAGSRTQWKAENANCIWRNVLKAQPWIEEWCRAHEGYGLYGEVTPTQGENFKYGSPDPQFFVFDIRSPEGTWLDYESTYIGDTTTTDLEWVPQLYEGPFDWEVISKLIDGQTTVPGAKGIREGIVIRPLKNRHVRGLGRLILKCVSNAYLSKETL